LIAPKHKKLIRVKDLLEVKFQSRPESTSPIDAHCEGHGGGDAQPSNTGWDQTGQRKQGCDEDTHGTKCVEIQQ
jgi:hypothetical protein